MKNSKENTKLKNINQLTELKILKEKVIDAKDLDCLYTTARMSLPIAKRGRLSNFDISIYDAIPDNESRSLKSVKNKILRIIKMRIVFLEESIKTIEKSLTNKKNDYKTNIN